MPSKIFASSRTSTDFFVTTEKLLISLVALSNLGHSNPDHKIYYPLKIIYCCSFENLYHFKQVLDYPI
jgi:hypothetical protein